MGLLCVVLFLQVPHKAHLEPIDVLDVPEDDFQLVVVEHVHTFPALTKIPLQQYQPQITARPSKIKLLHFTTRADVQVPLSLKKMAFKNDCGAQSFLDGFKINRKESVWKQSVNVGVLKIINSWEAPKGWFDSPAVLMTDKSVLNNLSMSFFST